MLTRLSRLLQHILDFGGYVYSDKENIDEAVFRAMVALLGDMASTINGVGSILTSYRPSLWNPEQEGLGQCNCKATLFSAMHVHTAWLALCWLPL